MTGLYAEILERLTIEVAAAREILDAAEVDVKEARERWNDLRGAWMSIQKLVDMEKARAEPESGEPQAGQVEPAEKGEVGVSSPEVVASNGGAPSGVDLSMPLRRRRRPTRHDIVSVMREQPNTDWSQEELEAEFGRRGWTRHLMDPRAVIRRAALNLIRDEQVVEIAPLVYRLADPSTGVADIQPNAVPWRSDAMDRVHDRLMRYRD